MVMDSITAEAYVVDNGCIQAPHYGAGWKLESDGDWISFKAVLPGELDSTNLAEYKVIIHYTGLEDPNAYVNVAVSLGAWKNGDTLSWNVLDNSNYDLYTIKDRHDIKSLGWNDYPTTGEGCLIGLRIENNDPQNEDIHIRGVTIVFRS